jgi:hypothetical protein
MTITITTDDLDNLAIQLALFNELDPDVEEVFGVYRPNHGIPYPFLAPLPNRATDVRENFAIWLSDVEATTKLGFSIIGYCHTHRPREGNSGPSPADLEDLPADYIGGVYMHGHDHVYWYETGRVVHASPLPEGEDL